MSHWIVVETMGTGAHEEIDPSVVFKGGQAFSIHVRRQAAARSAPR